MLGSSPLSRGILRESNASPNLWGIIPALAGNTTTSSHCRDTSGDHPRSRGEYDKPRVEELLGEGSSPLSRGIRTSPDVARHPARIIPALAGNTDLAELLEPDPGDHPRSRGEYSRGGDGSWLRLGSSPLSRGIPRRRHGIEALIRIIPALAGNTLADKGFYQLDLSDLGNPLLARLRFSKSLAPRLRRPSSWRGESSGSSPEGPGRTIRVSPS